MTIKQLKNHFNSKLQAIYPQTEIDSFFYMLSANYLGLSRVDIALNFNKEVNIPKKFNNAILLLMQQKPIQYILGNTFFYGLEFKVNEHVLIPRPETEELVDWIVLDNKSKQKLKIFDIGSGSGCIPISLSKFLNIPKVSSIDISEKALIVAKENAITNNVNVEFILDDILNLRTDFLTNKFDVIVSNPPYVRNLEKKEIQQNVLEFEPHLALFVSNDNPLLFYNAIADFAIKNLSKNGGLYLEINQYLGAETIQLLSDKGFTQIELKKDIFNNDRMIKASF